jgi:propionyl-CoA carboxylase alpha chain
MQAALSAYVIRGISHNISFLEAILGHPRFAKGDISTKFIDQEYPGGFIGAELTSDTTMVFLGAAIHIFLRDAERAARITGQLPGRERAIGARWVVTVDEENYSVYVRPKDYGYDISFDKGLIIVRSSWKLGRRLFQGTINGKPVSVKIKDSNEGYGLSYGGSEVRVMVRTPRVAELAAHMPKSQDATSHDKLTAPIAGMVRAIRVEEGETVKAGQELCVIEAMKMENVIYADHDVKIKKIRVTAPESVQAEQVIIEFEATVAGK